MRRRAGVRWCCHGAALLLPVVLLLIRPGHPASSASPYTAELIRPSAAVPRTLVLGIQGATLDQVLPLVAQGKLPEFSRLLQRGTHGRLSPFSPCLSPVVWQSLRTGKLPYKHRILDFDRYLLPGGPGTLGWLDEAMQVSARVDYGTRALADKQVVAGRVSEAAARTVAARLAELPIIRAEPTLRAPAVYSEASLRTILAEMAAAVPCAVGAGDLDRVLSQLLTSWLPCFLKEAEATVANAAAEGLSAEDLAIVEEATMAILTGCESGQLEILRLKLAGRSDEHIAESLGLSRPTVSKRKRAAMGRLEDSLTGLDQPLRLAVLDELGVRLEAARGGLRGKG